MNGGVFLKPAIILCSAAVFLALILNLAAKPRFTKKLNGIFVLIAAAGGLFFYGSGFAYVLSDPLQMIVRTIFDVCRMFAGVNDFGAVSSAPVFQNQAAVTVFWLVHFMAFYAMASATISVLGENALKKLKFWIQRYGDSTVIYGLNEESASLARSLIAEGRKHITIVTEEAEPALEKAVSSAGALVRSDLAALEGGYAFLKSIGSVKGSPVLTLFAMDRDESRNLSYAYSVLRNLEECGADTEKTKLVLRGTENTVETDLAAAPGHFGFGDVRFFTDTELAARLLIRTVPPCEKMSFDSCGKAQGDFEAVIAGFGKNGRSVLRELLMNSQFEGSTFRAAVFSPGSDSENGYFASTYSEILSHYDISFYKKDARSMEFYEYLKEHAPALRYVVICTGSRKLDSEIFSEVRAFLASVSSHAAVCRSNADGISWVADPEDAVRSMSVFSSEQFRTGKEERIAMRLNYSYINDPETTPEKAWRDLDYFSRESSRASANFLPAFLKMTGLTEEQAAGKGFEALGQDALQNLARTEHLRWCAFHFAFGFSEMDDETVRMRGEEYLAEKKEKGSSKLRLLKDMKGRRHACLRSFDGLPALAELEAEYTGVKKDYQEMDLRNVLTLAEVLKETGEK